MTPDTVPGDLINLELHHRAETAAADARGKNSCHYEAYLAGKKVANHPWLTQHAGSSPERRAARKALRTAVDEILAVLAPLDAVMVTDAAP